MYVIAFKVTIQGLHLSVPKSGGTKSSDIAASVHNPIQPKICLDFRHHQWHLVGWPPCLNNLGLRWKFADTNKWLKYQIVSIYKCI